MIDYGKRRGAAGQQYAIIVGLVGVVAIVSITLVGSSVKTMFFGTSNILGAAVNSAGATSGAAQPPASAETPLYAFSSHTFTTCGASGRFGPNLGACTGEYGAGWPANTAWFNMATQGYQLWTVPATGRYRIVAAGAGGGNNGSYNGGRGAVISGEFNLSKNTVITILVGQRGGDYPIGCDAGSGGGSFVANAGTPLIVAGGGSGSTYGYHGDNASLTTTSGSADGAGNSSGNGGAAAAAGNDGGGGFYSDGGVTSSSYGDTSGHGFNSDGIGGESAHYSPIVGGFGGGTGGHGACWIGSGGAGGYSGGGAGGYGGHPVGGGGGSYNGGTNDSAATAVGNEHGQVTITRL